MPLLIVPLIALTGSALGFGVGFWTGSGASKLLKIGALGGGCYIAYKFAKELK